jgi:putative DNA primase/helicase
MRVWTSAIDPRGIASVMAHLHGRKLGLDDELAGRVIRWHPRIGAMLALFRNVLTGEPQAISRTFLDPEGKKLGRKFLGPTLGAAVMLDPFDFVTTGLHVGEGVETCMAARQLNLCPVWALGSSGGVKAFPALDGVECLTLLKEADDASARVCEACAARWFAAGREVFINSPASGKDLNDAIRVWGAS